MLNTELKDFVTRRILPRVIQPAQYVGGELNMVRKDHRTVRGKLCLAFPDMYTIGMSHHGLQVLYTLMNSRADWVCERAFTPGLDMEAELRRHGKPLYSLETFTPLAEFDVLGFTLQYEICTSNLLTMLDLGGIPLRSTERTIDHPLVIAGGPCAQNPEPLAPFIDLFVTGDGEPSLPLICDEWLTLKTAENPACGLAPEQSRRQREELLAQLAAKFPFAYVPRFYEPEYFADGRVAAINRTRSDVPETIEPSVISDLDATPLPTKPILPFVECVHDRIAIEIMRGCPWQCRFCQSTVIKRPLRVREVETIVASGAGIVPAHRPQRNFAPVAFDQRLSVLRAARAADERSVRPAGREHCVSELARERGAESRGLADRHRTAFRHDACPGSGPRRHARTNSQENQQRRSVRWLPRGVSKRHRQSEAVFHVRPARRAAKSIWTASSTWRRRSPGSAKKCAASSRR